LSFVEMLSKNGQTWKTLPPMFKADSDFASVPLPKQQQGTSCPATYFFTANTIAPPIICIKDTQIKSNRQQCADCC
jgi:hypothetical protein